MAEIRQFEARGYTTSGHDMPHPVAPGAGLLASTEKYCVYNQTRERFVATDVEGGHASPDEARSRLRAMGQSAGSGLWIHPVHEISPSSIRLPMDLVFLDDAYTVLAVVESFPLASAPALSANPSSMLTFPADTLANGELRAGDRLIVAKPEEMKQHLHRMNEAKAQAPSSLESYLEQFAIAPAETPAAPPIENPVESAVDSGTVAPLEAAPAKAEFAGGEGVREERPVLSPAAETDAWKKRIGNRSWLTNLLMGDPVDPRVESREMVPGLIAYYFTGGNPVAQEVRDISATGIYIVTNERWYPGTVVRVTLTDRDHPTADRTLTVNAKAVRWGKDGVGLELVLEKADQDSAAIAQTMEHTLGVDPERVESFMENLKTPPPAK